MLKWTAENKVKAGLAGGLEVVVKAINTHIDNDSICEFGCGALWNMINDNSKTVTNNKQSNKQLRTKWRQEQKEE